MSKSFVEQTQLLPASLAVVALKFQEACHDEALPEHASDRRAAILGASILAFHWCGIYVGQLCTAAECQQARLLICRETRRLIGDAPPADRSCSPPRSLARRKAR